MKNIITIVVLFLIGGPVFAQDKLTDEKRKEFDAQKVAFFTQQLDLSPAEAAVFWPLYNEMQKKKRTIEGNMRKKCRQVCEARGLKEENYKQAIGELLEAEKQVLSIKETYYDKMLAVLPASKIWRLGEAEHKFHRQLFDKLRRESCPKK